MHLVDLSRRDYWQHMLIELLISHRVHLGTCRVYRDSS